MKKEIKEAIKTAASIIKLTAPELSFEVNQDIYEDKNTLVTLRGGSYPNDGKYTITVRHDSGCYFYIKLDRKNIFPTVDTISCEYDKREFDREIKQDLLKFKFDLMFEVSKHFI